MMNKAAGWLPLLVIFAFPPAAGPRNNAQAAESERQSAAESSSDTQAKNIQEYIELLRSNVRQEKAQIMGAVMQLSAADAAKFWPIYAEYDAELTKINDQLVAKIQEFARNYSQLTNEKAHELAQNAMEHRKMRSELLAKYYDRVKQSLGGITAARFLQVENQLLLIIDLQIDSSLPLVGGSS